MVMWKFGLRGDIFSYLVNNFTRYLLRWINVYDSLRIKVIFNSYRSVFLFGRILYIEIYEIDDFWFICVFIVLSEVYWRLVFMLSREVVLNFVRFNDFEVIKVNIFMWNVSLKWNMWFVIFVNINILLNS